MNKIYLTLALFIGFSLSTSACLTDGVTFQFQHEIDDFSSTYPGCTEIEGDVTILGSYITNLEGLSQLTTINGKLRITGLDNITSLSGLENVVTVGGMLYLDAMPELEDLTALSSLTMVGEELTVRYCPLVKHLFGLENLEHIGGKLYIDQMDGILNLQGLDNLSWIGENLTVRWCPSILTLDGINNLTAIGGFLEMFRNVSLRNLFGLENLTQIDGHILITMNDNLNSICGIKNIDPTTINSYGDYADLRINYNPMLSYCSIESVYEKIQIQESTIGISNNMEGCNNQDQVSENYGVGTDFCLVYTGIDEETITPKTVVYPNPAMDNLNINLTEFENTAVTIQLVDITGKTVRTIDRSLAENVVWIPVNDLQSGMYILNIHSDEYGTFSEKVSIRR